MAFAMGGSTSWLCWVVGGLTVMNGLFNALVIATHPAFRAGGELSARDDPWARTRSGEEEIGAFLRSRPDLVLGALAAVRSADAEGAGARARGGSSSSFGGGAATVASDNPYALALAAGEQPSGPGRGAGEPEEVFGGGYGFSSLPPNPSYSEASVMRNAFGGSAVGGGGGGVIRVQTVTQSVTSTVVHFDGRPRPK